MHEQSHLRGRELEVLLRTWVEPEEPFGVTRLRDGRRQHCLERELHERGVEVRGDLPGRLPGAEVGDLRCVRLVRHASGVPDQVLAHHQSHEVGFAVADGEVAGHHFVEADAGLRDLGFDVVPALENRLVQPFLAPEVIRDQLLVDARPLGDLADAGTFESLRRELGLRGIEQRPLRLARLPRWS